MMTTAHENTFWRQVGTASISCIVLMIGWWLAQGRNVAMREDVEAMIKRDSPYVVDKQIIFERINNLESYNQTYMKAWDKNIEVINELKIELARLRFILENMEKEKQAALDKNGKENIPPL